MASAPQPQLPLFYKDLTPLNSRDHANYRAHSLDRAPWAAGQHAIPLTVDEFRSMVADASTLGSNVPPCDTGTAPDKLFCPELRISRPAFR